MTNSSSRSGSQKSARPRLKEKPTSVFSFHTNSQRKETATSHWDEYNLIMPNGDVFGEEVGVKLVNCGYIKKADKAVGLPILMVKEKRMVAFIIDPNTKVILHKLTAPPWMKRDTWEEFLASISLASISKDGSIEQKPVSVKTKKPNPSPRRTTL